MIYEPLPNMVTVSACSKLKTSWNRLFYKWSREEFLIFCGVGFFNKTIIPPALTGYEMVDSQLGALSTISYLTRTNGIIVLNYFSNYFGLQSMLYLLVPSLSLGFSFLFFCTLSLTPSSADCWTSVEWSSSGSAVWVCNSVKCSNFLTLKSSKC